MTFWHTRPIRFISSIVKSGEGLFVTKFAKAPIEESRDAILRGCLSSGGDGKSIKGRLTYG